ncbi:MAG: amino acid permease [Actinobacteria bacterium]|nr:amino acid permease [Actinomycetota bacterium]
MAEQYTGYVRKSTGLVRTGSFTDMFVFGLSSVSPFPVGLAVGIFWAFAVFPRTNIIAACLWGILISIGGWITFSLLATVMPRVGGDYLYVSRILHPALGFTSNLMVFFSTAMAVGFWTAWYAQIGIGPMVSIFGTLINSDAWVAAGAAITKPLWVILIGVVMLALMAWVQALGLKKALIVENICFFIGLLGFVIAVIVMLITSRETFVAAFNSFAQKYTNDPDSYNYIIKTAAEAGLQYPSQMGYSGISTLGTIYITGGLISYTWWTTYLAGEMKAASSVKRQFAVVMGTGALNGVLLALFTGLFIKVVGSDFFFAANYLNVGAPDQYPLPVQPWYNFFAALIANNPVVSFIIAFTFVFLIWPGVFINVAMVIRALFAWSFDGLVPYKWSEVNERTHAPVIAIVIMSALGVLGLVWTALSATFFTVWGTAILFAYLPILFVGIAAIALPFRRKEFYNNSPLGKSNAGKFWLIIGGILSIAEVIFILFLGFRFSAELGWKAWWVLLLAIILAFVIAFVVYYVMKSVRAKQGKDLTLVYKQIPPE